MTQARDLCFKTIDRISKRFPDLKELRSEGDRPQLVIPTQENPQAGCCRVWQGDRVHRMVYIGLTDHMVARHIPGSPKVHIDSHMLFAFTDKHSPVPHFTLDAIFTEAPGMPTPILAYHLDLIPRVDLGANLAYMNAVYQGPVTEAQQEAKKDSGYTVAPLSARQLAVMSPWMLANRATPEAFSRIPVATYFERWAELVEKGLPAEATPDLGAEDFALRDCKNRKVLFSKEVDPVWDQIERAIGAPMGERLRDILIQQDRD